MDLQELRDTNDPKEHARRLALHHALTVGKVWQLQKNGEWWLVDCPLYDGTTGHPLERTRVA